MHFTPFQLVLWWVSPILQGAVAVGMLRRGLSRELPVFFGYTIYRFVLFWVTLLAYRSSYSAYFYVVWGSELLDTLLVVLVIQEVFSSVFRPYEALRSVGGRLFRCTLLVLVGASILLAMSATDGGLNRLIAELLLVQRSTLFIEAGLVLFLFLFARLFGLTWRSYSFGVSLGFGVTACMAGMGFAMLTQLGTKGQWWWTQFVSAGYFLGAVVWLFYVFAPSTSLEVDGAAIDLSPLNSWNRALKEMLKRHQSAYLR